MNEKKFLSYLEKYHLWLKDHKDKAVDELAEREAHAKEMRKFNQEKLLKMTEEDFYNLLSPLWAMGMWGNKHYKINTIIEDNSLELLRVQFANLLYGKETLAKRWDEFRKKIKGIGPGIMSEILNKAYPDQCILWNSKTKNGFTILEVPNTPRYDSAMDGNMYFHLSECGKKMLDFAKAKGYNDLENLIALDYFIWQEVQKDTEVIEPKDVEVPKGKKESGFVHNDIRDIAICIRRIDIIMEEDAVFKSWLHQFFSGELKYTKVGDNLYEVDVDEDRPIADFPVYVNVRNERRFFRRTPIKDAQSEGNRTKVILTIPRLRQQKALHLCHLIREYKLFEWWS